MGVKIVKHQTFEVIHVFENEPDAEEVFEVIEKHYGKDVEDYQQLDAENFMFKFDDKSIIELLIRNTK